MKHTVLLIDDNPTIRSTLHTLLEHKAADYISEIYEAADGKEALSLASEHQPQLCICDWMLPETNGGVLGHQLKELYPEMKLIILTARTDNETHRLAIEIAHADRVLLKPIDPDDLMGHIITLLTVDEQGI